jgi:RecJ-like exonuclease
MKFDDLAIKCKVCGGRGMVQSLEWEEWNKKFLSKTHIPIDEFLKEHPFPSVPEELVCGECEGKGYVPTEAGRALLRFLRMMEK